MPKEDDGSGNCVFVPNHHRCDDGSASGLASPVSDAVTGGGDRANQFNNAVNKKLACCLNSFHPGDPFTKFDCIENSKTNVTDFNTLWASSDDSGDGGQLAAFVLTNSLGKALSGFYTLSGTRCAEFSEFAGDLQPAKVNPAIPAGSMDYANHKTNPNEVQTIGMGTAYPLPSSAAYSDLKIKFQAQGKSVPTTAADRRRCPILVRAAAQYQCPDNPLAPASKKSYKVAGKNHCPIASSIQVHIRIEQLTEIAGMPKFKPEDTVINPKNASAISLERIIADKYGNQCPPGSHLSGNACVDN